MIVRHEKDADLADVPELILRLKEEKFAEGCFIHQIEEIGHPEKRKLLITAYKARIGIVLLVTEAQSSENIIKAIKMLRESVEGT